MPGPKSTEKPKIDEDYRCPLSLKKIHKIIDPVLTPSGHIYERQNIVDWIISSGGKDPLDVSKPLTVVMLVDGFAVREIVKKFVKDVKDLKKEVTDLKQDMKDMKQVLNALNEQNTLLKKQVVLATWGEHGKDIDKKLKKGSSKFASKERTTALQNYKDKIIKSADDQELEKAVQATAPLIDKKISSHRYLSWFRKYSSTTTVALEFQDKVTASKGWGNV